ncbi:Longitudinals lacking protein, isoform G [Anthophora plagiata]
MLEKLQEEGSPGGASEDILWQRQTAMLPLLHLSYLQEIELEETRELILWEDYQVFDPATIAERCSYEASYFASNRKSVRAFRSKRTTDPVAGRYKCSKCSKSYRWKHHLVEHVKASCGQKKAECCPYCSYRRWYYDGGRTRYYRRRYGKCELERVKSAVEAVANGLSFRKAARMFCMSKSVLHRYKSHSMGGYLNCQRVTYPCKNCGKVYNYYSSLARHLKHECGVEPKFHCPLCPYRTKHKSSLNTHLNGRHMKLLSEFYAMPNGNKLSSSMDAGN